MLCFLLFLLNIVRVLPCIFLFPLKIQGSTLTIVDKNDKEMKKSSFLLKIVRVLPYECSRCFEKIIWGPYEIFRIVMKKFIGGTI